METQKLLIEIDVNANDATQEIIKQRTALGDLRAEVNDLKAANEKLYAQEKIDTDAINANKAAIIQKEGQIKNLTAEMKVNEKVVQAATKNTQDETGAYAQLSLQYQVAAQKAKDMATVHGVNSEEAKKATSEAQKMSEQLKEVDASVGQNQRSVGDYTNAILKAIDALKKQATTLEAEKLQLNENKNALVIYKSTLDSTSQEYKDNEVAIRNNKLALDQNKNAINQNKLELKEHKAQLALGESGISGFGDKLSLLPGTLGNVGSSLSMVGNSMKTMLLNPVVLVVAAIAAIGAGVVALVKNSMEFSKEMSMLSAITGATGDDLDYLKQSAKDLGATYGKSAVEIVTAMKLVGSAKPELLDNVQALKAVTEAVLVLSKATGMDMTEATQGVTTIMNQFALSADEVNRTINVLAAGSKYGAVEVDYLKESISKVGTIAKAANVSLEATVAAMELFGEKGIKAETAGTGFKSILGKLQADAKNYTNGLFDLNKAIDNNTSISGNNLELQKKFGAEFYGMAGILLTNKDRFKELTEQVTGTNVAYEQMAIANDNLKGDTEKLSGAWDKFLLGLEDGDGVLSKLTRSLVQGLTWIVNGLTNLSTMVGEAFTAVNNAFMYSDKALWGFFESIKIVATGVSKAFAALKSGDLKGVGDAFKDIGTGIKGAFDMKSVTAIINTNKEVKEHEKSVRAAIKADAEMQKEKAENAKKQEALTKAETSAREKRQKEIDKAQATELKSLKDNITIKQNAYKDDYKKSELLDKEYFDKKSTAIEEIYALEIAEIEKKKQFGKLTIEEETLARSAADKNKKTAFLQLNADLNAEMIKALDETLKLEDIAQKASLIGIVQTEEQKHIATIDGINKRYEAEKKKIELTISDETEKANRLKLLNAQYNLDIKTENQKNDDAIKKQALVDEAELLQSKNEMVQNAIDKEYNSKFAALEKEKQERLKNVTEGSEAEFAIRAEYIAKEAELERQKNLEKAQAIVGYAQQAADLLGELNNFITALGEREYADFEKQKYSELELWAQSNKDKEGFDEEYAAKKKAIDAELDEKKAELEYEAGKRAKALAIVNAIINGASAVIAALATPLIGVPLAIAAGVMAAAQLATIIATPIPDNRKGGSAGSSGGSITQPTVPNTSPTTNGVINEKTYGSNEVLNKQTTNTIENNSGGYVPVLVTTDLTKQLDKQNTVKVLNTME